MILQGFSPSHIHLYIGSQPAIFDYRKVTNHSSQQIALW